MTSSITPLDHGVLNIPNRTKNIDAEIDRYKAGVARDAAAQRRDSAKVLAAQRVEAKALVASMPTARIAELAKKLNTTTAEVRQMLKSNAHWQPTLIIKTAGR